MKERIEGFFEQLFFAPRPYHVIVILFLSPFSLLYGSMMLFRRFTAKRERFPVPIISVGNLLVGGSGKTPFVIALASRYPGATVISKGYGRQSRGLVEVSRNGDILVHVKASGDEAMLMAESLSHATVIVSEDRKRAIRKAIADGASLIILDDGFNRVDIEKFEIVLEPEKVVNRLPFPAGPFREFAFIERSADLVLYDERDFRRKVFYTGLTERMLLATAIARPERLEPYLPEGVVSRVFLPDHAYFDEEELKRLMQECRAESLLVTRKDAVKMNGFKLRLSIMELELSIDDEKLQRIDAYIKKFRI